jgi:hypothetical protein
VKKIKFLKNKTISVCPNRKRHSLIKDRALIPSFPENSPIKEF